MESMVLESNVVATHLETAFELKKCHRFYDMHVHPYELIQNRLIYENWIGSSDICGVAGANYLPPRPGRFHFRDTGMTRDVPENLRRKFFEMKLHRLYACTGPGVITDHMALCGIDRALLLPVPGVTGDFARQMEFVAGLFRDDDRFFLAGSLPNDVDTRFIDQYLSTLVRRFGILALKIHPNVTGIDLGSRAGRERIESVLQACDHLDLPLIIHGGRSSLLEHPEMGGYGVIENLISIPWQFTRTPVVIAHAGLYGLEERETGKALLLMMEMLRRHDNLLVDIADLPLDAVSMIVEAVDAGRILFGSDALYCAPWNMMLKLLLALSQRPSRFEERFLRIVSENPEKYIFNRRWKAQEKRFTATPSVVPSPMLSNLHQPENKEHLNHGGHDFESVALQVGDDRTRGLYPPPETSKRQGSEHRKKCMDQPVCLH